MIRNLLLLDLLCLLTCPAMAQDPVRMDSQHYRLEYENDQVRVLRLTLGPKHKTPMHQHPATLMVFVTETHLRETFQDRPAQEERYGAGFGLPRFRAVRHTVENLSNQPLDVTVVELKTVRTQERVENEGSAMESLSTLVKAQVTYSLTVGNGAYGSLADLEKAVLIDRVLASGIKDGYKFVVAGDGDTTHFTVTATPLKYLGTGDIGYYSDETGIVRSNFDGSTPSANTTHTHSVGQKSPDLSPRN